MSASEGPGSPGKILGDRFKVAIASDPSLKRLADVDERFRDPDDPGALLSARMQEVIRNYAAGLGLCAECLAKFPDPLRERPC